jgi:UDP-N-acetylmuramoyl-L-alanyl-D-glutamate--2,6-diaminopimelate ligase
VAGQLADRVVLTAEDPRTEPLDGILAESAAGAVSRGKLEGRDLWCIRDRGQAIQFAVDLAKAGDVVMVCGKAHEQSMCFGETEYPWDDRAAVRAALNHRLGIGGPDMPRLPTSPDWKE